MSIDERLDRLTGIVESLPATVVAHDNRIEALVQVAEKQSMKFAELEKRWEAYLNTLPNR